MRASSKVHSGVRETMVLPGIGSYRKNPAPRVAKRTPLAVPAVIVCDVNAMEKQETDSDAAALGSVAATNGVTDVKDLQLLGPNQSATSLTRCKSCGGIPYCQPGLHTGRESRQRVCGSSLSRVLMENCSNTDMLLEAQHQDVPHYPEAAEAVIPPPFPYWAKQDGPMELRGRALTARDSCPFGTGYPSDGEDSDGGIRVPSPATIGPVQSTETLWPPQNVSLGDPVVKQTSPDSRFISTTNAVFKYTSAGLPMSNVPANSPIPRKLGGESRLYCPQLISGVNSFTEQDKQGAIHHGFSQNYTPFLQEQLEIESSQENGILSLEGQQEPIRVKARGKNNIINRLVPKNNIEHCPEIQSSKMEKLNQMDFFRDRRVITGVSKKFRKGARPSYLTHGRGMAQNPKLWKPSRSVQVENLKNMGSILRSKSNMLEKRTAIVRALYEKQNSEAADKEEEEEPEDESLGWLDKNQIAGALDESLECISEQSTLDPRWRNFQPKWMKRTGRTKPQIATGPRQLVRPAVTPCIFDLSLRLGKAINLNGALGVRGINITDMNNLKNRLLQNDTSATNVMSRAVLFDPLDNEGFTFSRLHAPQNEAATYSQTATIRAMAEENAHISSSVPENSPTRNNRPPLVEIPTLDINTSKSPISQATTENKGLLEAENTIFGNRDISRKEDNDDLWEDLDLDLGCADRSSNKPTEASNGELATMTDERKLLESQMEEAALTGWAACMPDMMYTDYTAGRSKDSDGGVPVIVSKYRLHETTKLGNVLAREPSLPEHEAEEVAEQSNTPATTNFQEKLKILTEPDPNVTFSGLSWRRRKRGARVQPRHRSNPPTTVQAVDLLALMTEENKAESGSDEGKEEWPISQDMPVVTPPTITARGPDKSPSARKIEEFQQIWEDEHAHSDEEIESSEHGEEAGEDDDDSKQEKLSDIVSHPDFRHGVFHLRKYRMLPMRKTMPPLQPKKICFTCPFPGCTHSEIKNVLENEAGVKIKTLQFDPIYMQDNCSGNAKKSRWILELSPDSNRGRLLMYGFRLRDSFINVRCVDDVHREEVRAYELYNDICLKNHRKANQLAKKGCRKSHASKKATAVVKQ